MLDDGGTQVAADDDGEKKELEIDNLLDEFESTFLTNHRRYDPKKIVVSNSEAALCECTKKTDTDWAEVEELLRDFKFEDQNPFSRNKNKPWNRQPVGKLKDVIAVENTNLTAKDVLASSEVSQDLLKCFPVYLAGSLEVMGYSQTGFEKPCDRLKCVKCDFKVESFDNLSWDSTVDYLFLRNNMPDFDKISGKLKKTRGSRAYACQCQHVSITKLTNVNALPQVRWVCGKHTSSENGPGEDSLKKRRMGTSK